MECADRKAWPRVWHPHVFPSGALAKFKLGLIFGLQGKLYTLGGVQSKTVDQYDVETDTWANFFPSLR